MTLSEFLEHVNNGRIPPGPPDYLVRGHDRLSLIKDQEEYMNYYKGRTECTNAGMWGVVDMEWTKTLADWINGRTVLEIMAGRGWLTKALRLWHVDILATDNNSSHSQWRKDSLLTDVEHLEASTAIKKYSENFDLLLCSWPPMDTSITKAIRRWKTEKPIIYIGEGSGGCNATQHFWAWFEGEINDQIVIPQWDGIHDCIYIGHCKKEPRN
jgi:hypothetical protein